MPAPTCNPRLSKVEKKFYSITKFGTNSYSLREILSIFDDTALAPPSGFI